MDTQMHERKVTGKEKGQSFIAVNKILGVCDLHDYIRAELSAAKLKKGEKASLVCFVKYEWDGCSKSFLCVE